MPTKPVVTRNSRSTASKSSNAAGRTAPRPSSTVKKSIAFIDDTEGLTSDETFVEYESQIAAINKVMAVIEFDLDGTVLTANANFLATLGYSLDDALQPFRAVALWTSTSLLINSTVSPTLASRVLFRLVTM